MSVIIKNLIFWFLIPVILILLSITAPLYGLSFEAESLISPIALTFGILAGFFIANATANYLSLQTLLAEESGGLRGLFNLGKLVQPEAKEKIANSIDNYLISTLDFPLISYVDNTENEFGKIVETIDDLCPTGEDKHRISALNYMHEIKSNLFKTRQTIRMMTPRVTSFMHWIILITLVVLLAFLFLLLRQDTLLSKIITGCAIASIYLIMILIKEVDNNTFLEESLAFGDVQSTFKAIGRLPYYPPHAFKRGYLKAPSGKYRTANYKNYSASMEKELTTIEVKHG